MYSILSAGVHPGEARCRLEGCGRGAPGGRDESRPYTGRVFSVILGRMRRGAIHCALTPPPRARGRLRPLPLRARRTPRALVPRRAPAGGIATHRTSEVAGLNPFEV